ncbi:protein-L-isoaspartate O-methyltransferase family protein [Actinomadura atramentaria]|uniref:protein-L-isoaspartate O-methyltransferase family protein n=1 Tax=Actinomadura atramentaria TaxID=1990 RepID=UPI00036BA9B8|nr:methyltransferase domain-containing protein [Actinomadura atramentaria]
MSRFGQGVDRRLFIPDRIFWFPPDADLTPVDRADDPGLWERLVAADDAVITQIYHDRNGIAFPSSSSSAPFLMRAMINALELEPGMKVLEIGAGTGYNAALLADAGAEVVTIEIDAALAAAASAALDGAGFADRVTVLTGDGEDGAPRHAPFDRVIVTAAARTIPYRWVEQTRDGGRLVVPYSGPERVGALLVLDVADGTARGRAVGDARFMPLRGQRQTQGVVQAEPAGPLDRLNVTVTSQGQTVAFE